MADRDDIRRSLRARGYLMLEQPATPVGDDLVVEQSRSFVTSVGERTMLVSSVGPRIVASSNHVLRLSGRFVGSGEPNRNGAMWTVGDLQMGLPSVPGGPLNWLHQEHHIVGAITDARLVTPGLERAAVVHPYIEAESNLWAYLRPAEAAVIRSAAEQDQLFYSMECVSRAIQCQSCMVEFAYVDVMRKTDKVCAELREGASVRRLVDPLFLGGAVIVPPVRPGWADAELRVQASALAEQTFDQAGMPDVTAAVWEVLMASLIKLAR